MSKVQQVTVRVVRVPMTRPHRTSGGVEFAWRIGLRVAIMVHLGDRPTAVLVA